MNESFCCCLVHFAWYHEWKIEAKKKRYTHAHCNKNQLIKFTTLIGLKLNSSILSSKIQSFHIFYWPLPSFFWLIKCRCWRIGKINDRQANEDHPRVGLFAGGMRTVSARGIQQHNSELDGHYSSDGPTENWLPGAAKHGCGQTIFHIRLGGRRGRIESRAR